jgi:hypothetical protein
MFLGLWSVTDADKTAFAKSTQEIEFVKTGELGIFLGVAIGPVTDNFMANCRWGSLIGADGNKYVNATGNITYMEKQIEAVLQFNLDKANNSFEINALEFNEIPRSRAMLEALKERKICLQNLRSELLRRTTEISSYW